MPETITPATTPPTATPPAPPASTVSTPFSVPATFGNSTGIGMNREGLSRPDVAVSVADDIQDFDPNTEDANLDAAWGADAAGTETHSTQETQETQPHETQQTQTVNATVEQVLQGAKPQDRQVLTEIAVALQKRHGNLPPAVLKQLAHQELALRKFKGEVPSSQGNDDVDTETAVADSDTEVIAADGTDAVAADAASAEPATADSDAEEFDGILDDLTEFERERLEAAKPKPTDTTATTKPPTRATTPPPPLTAAESWMPEGTTPEEAQAFFGHGEFGTTPEDVVRYQAALVERIDKGEAKPADWAAFQQKLLNRQLFSDQGRLVVETIINRALQRVGIDVAALGEEMTAATHKRANEQAFRDLLSIKDAKGNQPFANIRDLNAVPANAKPKLKLPGGIVVANTPMNRIIARHGQAIQEIQVPGRNPAETARLTATARLRHIYKLHKESVAADTARTAAVTKTAVTAGKAAEKAAVVKTNQDIKRTLNGNGAGTSPSPTNTKVANSNGASQHAVPYSQVMKGTRGKTFQDM